MRTVNRLGAIDPIKSDKHLTGKDKTRVRNRSPGLIWIHLLYPHCSPVNYI
ncbi:MAG: hypothetical protein ACRC62_00240 [Microcoleus sp.]